MLKLSASLVFSHGDIPDLKPSMLCRGISIPPKRGGRRYSTVLDGGEFEMGGSP